MRSIPEEDRNPDYERFFAERGVYSNADLVGHIPRYLHALRHMPFGKYLRAGQYSTALELGTTYIFPQILLDKMGFTRVDVTDFSVGQLGETTVTPLPKDPQRRETTIYNIDLERMQIPCANETYDLILCFEVIEHLEVDPMFMISEINRTLKTGGLLFLSTPNSVSARNVYKILRGFAPHFFMKYLKGGSYFRHNIEYAPHQMIDAVRSGGFEIRKMWTQDTFEETIPEAIDFLSNNGFTTEYRGDNMFIIAEKRGPVLERYPASLYA